MKREWIIAGIVVVALVLLGRGIMNNTLWKDVTVPKPLTGEAARNPFYAAQKLSNSLGARAEWRRTLDVLPPRDAVLLLSRWDWNLIDERRRRIEAWVESGGHLVIDGEIDLDDYTFEEWSGLGRALTQKDVKDDEARSPERPYLLNNFGRCDKLRAQHDSQRLSAQRTYTVCNLTLGGDIATAREPEWSLADASGLQAARVRVGDGSVTLLNTNAFINHTLKADDHAWLFVAATQLVAGRHIVMLTEEQYPSLLTLLWRHGAPVIVIALLALALYLWRDGVRFGPPAAPWSAVRRSLAEQIRGTGLFARQFGGGRALHAAAVRAVIEAAAHHIPRYRHLTMDERLTLLARLTGVDCEELGVNLNFSGPRRPRELRAALEQLEHVRRTLEEPLINPDGLATSPGPFRARRP